MICFHDASLNKGRTNTKLIDRDFPHQVEMIGCSLESICYDLEGPFHVRFSPESRRVRCTGSCLLWAKSGHCPVLFERLVSELLKPQRDSKTKPLCSFQVDYQKIF